MTASAGRASPFSALLASPGVAEVFERRSRFGFMAFHGGLLEERTDVIASRAAVESGSSFYGVLLPPDLQWHIPSARVRPADSAKLTAFLHHVDAVVAVHGFGRDGFWTTLLLGGSNRSLAEHLAEAIRPALAGYAVVTDLERIPAGLRGLHADNPCNLTRSGGVQLELPPRVRGNTPRCPTPDTAGLVPDARGLVTGLAAAARSWPPPAGFTGRTGQRSAAACRCRS